MRELTKHAVETLYKDDLKHRLEVAFGTLMSEITELPDGIYGQYTTNALKNLIQLSARGVTDLNVNITEYLNDSSVLYANYEDSFEKIKELDEIALAKKFEQDTYYEDYAQKSLEYNRLRKEYNEEKGMEDNNGDELLENTTMFKKDIPAAIGEEVIEVDDPVFKRMNHQERVGSEHGTQYSN